ncbi:hypothetical protein, partial [Streptococcus pneumoniae]|uniref:hypothetical protein n=1 Tax=Streptococcus pneumoniae TaxID=1313 RepID=UPI0018B02512
VQQSHPEIVKWAGDGLPLKLIQNLNAHASGAEMIKELRASLVIYVESAEVIAAEAAAMERQILMDEAEAKDRAEAEK